LPIQARRASEWSSTQQRTNQNASEYSEAITTRSV